MTVTMPLEALAATYLEVLDDEYWALKGQPPTPDAAVLREKYVAAMVAQQPGSAGDEEVFRMNLLKRLHDANRSAICFSGGGIRSATFGLEAISMPGARSGHRRAAPCPGSSRRVAPSG
jgi:hypothetical protein